MRPSSALVQPARHGGRNAVRQAVPRRRSMVRSYAGTMLLQDAPYLRRFLHAARAINKPRPSLSQAYQHDSGRVYNMQTDLSGDLPHAYFPDPHRILAEWRLLEQQALEGLKGKNKVKDAETIEDRDSNRSEGNYFTPSYHTRALQTMEPDILDDTAVASTSTPLESASRSKSVSEVQAQHNETLWIATLDPASVSKAMMLTMSEIRNGQRDMQVLTEVALDIVGRHGITHETCDLCREQVRISILSHWLAIVRKGLEGNMHEEKLQVLLLHITESLYRSSVHHYIPPPQHSQALMAIQRATLHRIGASVLERTSAQSTSLTSVALRLASLILRDTRLKGSQTRFMTRRVVKAFEVRAIRSDSGACATMSPYKEMSTSLIALLRRGLFRKTEKQNGETGKQLVMRYLRACELEASRQRKAGRTAEGPKKFVEDCYVPLALELCKPHTSNLEDTEDKANGGLRLSKSDLTTLIRNMVQADQFADARRAYTSASPKLRTFEGACYLMRRWSGTPLNLSQVSEVTVEAPRNSFAFALSTAACDQLQWNDEAKVTHQLQLMAASRFARHLRQADVHSLLADLDEYSRCWRSLPGQVGNLTRSGVLACLGERAQLTAVRTFAHCHRVGHAIQIASRLVKAHSDDSYRSHFSTKLANAIFVSSIPREHVGLSLRQGSSVRMRNRFQPASIAFTLHKRPSTGDKARKMQRGLDVLQRFCKSSQAPLNTISSILVLRQMAYCRGIHLPGSVLRTLAREVAWHSSKEMTAVGALDQARRILQILSDPSRERRAQSVLQLTEDERQRYHVIEGTLCTHRNRNHTTNNASS